MIGNKRILCVVTARAGSRGLPGKNYKELMGKPLFEWSVLASMNSKYVDKTVISSNCKEIENIYIDRILKASGGEEREEWEKVVFIKRPENISGDLSKNEEALIHSYQRMKEIEKQDYDIVVNLQPTSPCRYSSLLDLCIDEYYNGKYKSLFTANKYTPFFWKKINGKWEYMTGDDCCKRKMRQEFRNIDEENSDFLMHDNGNIYLTDVKVLLETECRISDNHMVYETTGMHNIQVDEEYDFNFIEIMLIEMGIYIPIELEKTKNK